MNVGEWMSRHVYLWGATCHRNNQYLITGLSNLSTNVEELWGFVRWKRKNIENCHNRSLFKEIPYKRLMLVGRKMYECTALVLLILWALILISWLGFKDGQLMRPAIDVMEEVLNWCQSFDTYQGDNGPIITTHWLIIKVIKTTALTSILIIALRF